MKYTLSLLLVLVILVSSCYYDKEDLLYGNTSNQPCTDTIGTVSYAQKLVPIFQQSCYSCHTGSSPSGGILMGTYNADKIIAQNGKLYGSIIHASGYKPMPESAPKLNNCKIAIIKKWVDLNMPNN